MMLVSVLIAILSVIAFILCILFQVEVPRGKVISVKLYPFVPLFGGLTMLMFGAIKPEDLAKSFLENSSVNPIKILVLFLSMTIFSLILDRTGFFRYISGVVLKKAGHRQTTVFLSLYSVISLLTVFTSNDIVILTFTPFICYFCKAAKVQPIPYLMMEFVAANTWSLFLLIGNPTNIYLATAGGIGFLEYFLQMILPTLAAGLVSLFVLFLIFRKKLKKPITALPASNLRIADKGLLVLGLLHLGGCTVLVASASFFDLPMWLICLCFALSLFVTTGIYCLIRRKKPLEALHTFFRVPWQLAPFMLSMFVLILTLQRYGITDKVTDFLGMGGSVFLYGIAAYLACNIINNIPMSVFFSAVLIPLTGVANTGATYAVIAASNLGAIFTPVGALAGIMWMSILREKNIKFTFADFTKYGVIVSLPALLAALFTLQFTI